MSNQEPRASARDLYKLRRSHLDAERQAIMAQLAQNRFKTILLGLELRYDLLASEVTLDINTGRIILHQTESVKDEGGDR
ncbi:MAG: hypothetical protein ACE5IA_05430 [Dehalococcoidia bacterium]